MRTICVLCVTATALSAIFVQQAAAQTEEMIARGAYLVNGPGACGNCHTKRGPDLLPMTSMFLAGGEKFDSPFYGLAHSKNLTSDKDTGIGTWTDAQVIRALREGITKEGNAVGEPMPLAYFNKISDEDATAIAAYLRTVTPIPNAVLESKYTVPLHSQPAAKGTAVLKTDKAAYGAYLVTVAHCLECHTPRNAQGETDYSAKLGAGGRTFFPIPGKVVRSANITSDKETGLGNWTNFEIKRAMTEGIGKDGRKLIPQMPYPYFKTMTNEDLDTIIAYVRTIPAITNKVPENPSVQIYLQ